MNTTDTTIASTVVPAAVRQVIRLVAPQPLDDISTEHRLVGDLGFHSLAQAELGFALEDLFNLDPITPEQAMRIDRVGDIEELIMHALGEELAELPTEAALVEFAGRYGSSWGELA